MLFYLRQDRQSLLFQERRNLIAGFFTIVGIAGNHRGAGEQKGHRHTVWGVDEVVGIDLTDERLGLSAVFFVNGAETVVVKEALSRFVVAQEGMISGQHG